MVRMIGANRHSNALFHILYPKKSVCTALIAGACCCR